MSFDSLRSLRMTSAGWRGKESFDSLRSLRMTSAGGGKQMSFRSLRSLRMTRWWGKGKQMSFRSLRSLRVTSFAALAQYDKVETDVLPVRCEKWGGRRYWYPERSNHVTGERFIWR